MGTLAASYGSTTELGERLNRHQIGCRWIRPGAPRSVAVAVSHGLNGNAGEMRSLFRVRRRIRDDGQRHVPIFHPSIVKESAGLRYFGLDETIGQFGDWATAGRDAREGPDRPTSFERDGSPTDAPPREHDEGLARCPRRGRTRARPRRRNLTNGRRSCDGANDAFGLEMMRV